MSYHPSATDRKIRKAIVNTLKVLKVIVGAGMVYLFLVCVILVLG